MISNDWNIVLQDEFQKEYFIKLMSFIDNEYNSKNIFPLKSNIFNAFNLCSFKETKVVIIGQDPYHNFNQAHGLAFSVLQGNKLPPSLRNIYHELKSDLGIENLNKTNLTPWAVQGILLVNTILTVEAHIPLSHAKKGWEVFFDSVIAKLNEKDEPVIFVLWGNKAIKYEKDINKSKHVVLKSSHPSPLSARHTFFGGKVFSKINYHLNDFGFKKINFKL
ncbi:MAG: uracil-DNA glycosylase [Candidatus Izemoplasma sp.]